MPNNFANQPRITIDGKFFRLGAEKFFVKGVSYGPFAPNGEMEMFPSREQAGRDFRQLQQLGVNLLRVYYVPPKWFLELAADFSIKLLIDIPWPSHLCFLESEEPQEQAREAVRSAALHCKDHSAVFALSVANEIPAEIVRWTGVKRVGAFIEELIGIVKSIDSNLLCTFASFPPTEFLTASNSDFISFNVYLHQAAAFQKYVARLQMLANAKPLLLAEVGLDSIREGEQRQADVLKEQLEIAVRAGLAGTIVYSFTDDWFKGGSQVRDWGFGLTNVAREPKRSFAAVKQFYEQAPYVPLSRQPKVSVVIASYNGARTLDACLASVTRLNYPDYEVILVDDGSTDETQNIVERYPRIQTLRQTNQGLSAARNAGITAASGEIVAFTDADCRVDEDWLYYLVQLLVQNNYMGVGGHNFLPPEDSPMAAVVLVSPGGPAHVMLTDEEAEHIPGCNMAFYKWALKEINGFDPVFRNAGDDVDVCWRLQERGYRLGFTPGGFVWHYRRATVRAYLRQQAGYGEAEALLIQKHPEHYNALGGNMWRGRIYGVAKYGLILNPPVIYHGTFGSGFFQKLYSTQPTNAIMLCTTFEYHLMVNLPIFLLATVFPFLWPLALAAFGASVAVCIIAGYQADLPPGKMRIWTRPLVALLFFLQPIVRGWARYFTRLNVRLAAPEISIESLKVPILANLTEHQLCFWSNAGIDRFQFLGRVVQHLQAAHWQTNLDSGWSAYDAEILRNRWSRLHLTTACEHLGNGRMFHRCRVEARWTLAATILFLGTLIAEGLAIVHFRSVQPWVWMLPLTIPLLAWFLDDEKRWQELQVLGVVQRSSAELGLEPFAPGVRQASAEESS